MTQKCIAGTCLCCEEPETKRDPVKAKHMTANRKLNLTQFAKALWVALESMPMGYRGAGEDRNRFCTPVEQVIRDIELGTELADQ